MYHDMGLVGGVLSPVYMSATMTLIESDVVYAASHSLLKTISKYRATTSGGPNFAYQLCIDKVTEEELGRTGPFELGIGLQRRGAGASEHARDVYQKILALRILHTIALSATGWPRQRSSSQAVLFKSSL